MFAKSAVLALGLSSLAAAVALPSVQEARTVDVTEVYDTIVVGGGPAGLSALSGLARIRRNAILIDSGDYRNNATRHMHDVIGLDGVTPAYYRWLAREKLADYPGVSLTNGTVTAIEELGNATHPSFQAAVRYPSGATTTLYARSIVLATGLTDILPDTPGLKENWGQGIYWCPWCDGYEHADQALGLISNYTDAASLVREVSTQNSDVAAFVNGTDTPANRAVAEASFADHEVYLAANGVTVYNQTIVSIEHLRSGINTSYDPSLATYPEYDLFRVNLDDGSVVERAAFLVDFPDKQKSNLGENLGVNLVDGRLAGNVSVGYLTNVPFVYAVGDNNIDRSTNVPHALYTGKRAAVFLHVALARLESKAEIAAAKANNGTADDLIHKLVTKRADDLEPRAVWERMNEAPGDVLYAGEF